MADIKQAAKWMEAGLTVHQEESIALAFINEHGVIRSIVKGYPIIPEHGYVFSYKDLLTEDWEIAE